MNKKIQKKSNTFDTLFGELLKTIQILAEKEMTQFQSQLYKNTLNSALEAKLQKENPFEPLRPLTPKEIDEVTEEIKEKNSNIE